MIDLAPLDCLPLLAGLFGSKTRVTADQDVLVAVETNPQVDIDIDVPPVDLRPIAQSQISLAETLARSIGTQTRAIAGALALQADAQAIDAAGARDQAGAIRAGARELALAAIGAVLVWLLARNL